MVKDSINQESPENNAKTVHANQANRFT